MILRQFLLSISLIAESLMLAPPVKAENFDIEMTPYDLFEIIVSTG